MPESNASADSHKCKCSSANATATQVQLVQGMYNPNHGYPNHGGYPVSVTLIVAASVNVIPIHPRSQKNFRHSAGLSWRLHRSDRILN